MSLKEMLRAAINDAKPTPPRTVDHLKTCILASLANNARITGEEFVNDFTQSITRMVQYQFKTPEFDELLGKLAIHLQNIYPDQQPEELEVLSK